jgi:hypothetical protein
MTNTKLFSSPKMPPNNLPIIGSRVMRNYAWLTQLLRTKSSKHRLALINSASADQLLSIVEIGSNVLRCPDFCLSNRQRSSLLPHASFVRQLSNSRSPLATRRIIQKGGGIAAISSLLIPILMEVSRTLLTNKSTD